MAAFLPGSKKAGPGAGSAEGKRTEVFVSATSGDLRTVREMVKQGLLTMGCFPIEQTNFEPDCRTVREMLETRLAQCDAIIHIVGVRYGAEPDPASVPEGQTRRSYTQMEVEIARTLGKKLYVFLCPKISPTTKNRLPKATRNASSSGRIGSCLPSGSPCTRLSVAARILPSRCASSSSSWKSSRGPSPATALQFCRARRTTHRRRCHFHGRLVVGSPRTSGNSGKSGRAVPLRPVEDARAACHGD